MFTSLSLIPLIQWGKKAEQYDSGCIWQLSKRLELEQKVGSKCRPGELLTNQSAFWRVAHADQSEGAKATRRSKRSWPTFGSAQKAKLVMWKPIAPCPYDNMHVHLCCLKVCTLSDKDKYICLLSCPIYIIWFIGVKLYMVLIIYCIGLCACIYIICKWQSKLKRNSIHIKWGCGRGFSCTYLPVALCYLINIFVARKSNLI